MIDCSKCKYQTWDWYIDDGHYGDEFEICTKGLEMYGDECNEFNSDKW